MRTSSSLAPERLDDYRFRFDSGSLCLDLVATVGRRESHSYDRLRTAQDIGRWCAEAGLLAEPPEISESALQAARTLREAIYRSVEAGRAARTPPVADVRLINEWALQPPPAPQLAADARGLLWLAAHPVEAVLSAVARDAVDLLSSQRFRRVRRCAGYPCSILFIDTSRPGRRRWCSMRRCGNKAKKSDYRRRMGRAAKGHR